MTIPFQNIPQNLRLPLFYAEVNNSQANTNQRNFRGLIIAQILAAGTAVVNVPYISGGVGDAVLKGGPGSMLASMVAAAATADPFGEYWVLPLADNGAGNVATGTFTVTAVATANGTLNLYIGGQLVQVAITTVMTTVTLVAASIVAAVNAAPNICVSAANTAGVVTFTSNHKGLSQNDIDIRVNYRGTAGGEFTPTGMTFTIAAMSGGTVNPVLTTAIANLGTQNYDVIINPYNDTTSISAITAYLNDQTGTWSWLNQNYGHAWYAFRGTYAGLVTFGTSLNDQHSSVLGFYDSPSLSWQIATDFAATCAVSLRADPAQPLHTLTLSTMLPPPVASRFIPQQQNTLAFDGISAFSVSQSGAVQLLTTITTYQKNSFGQADNSYLQINTMYNLASCLVQLNGAITSNFARYKLAADGTKFADGSNIVTPSTIKAFLIAQYQEMEYNGQVQNSAAFAKGLIVQQNAQNPNRVDILWDGILIDQLDIIALLAQFRLK
jgi:phage tail sheath gpL-like